MNPPRVQTPNGFQNAKKGLILSRLIFSLSRKALAAVVIILLPILITFVYGYKRNTALIKEQLLDNLSVASAAVEVQVDQFIETSRRITRDFSSDGLIIKELDGLAPRGRVAPARLNEHLTRNKLPLHTHVRAIHVVSDDGFIVSSTDSSFIGRDVSGEPFFMNAVTGQDVTEVVFGPEGVPAIAVTAPVKRPGTGRRTGMVVNFFTLSGLDDVLSGRFQQEQGASPRLMWGRKTTEAYLVDRDGAILAGARTASNGAQKLSLTALPLRTCLNKKETGSGFYRNQMGVDVAGASTCMPALQWTILVERNELEALAPFKSMRRDAIIAGVVVAGLISLLFIAFYRTVVLQLQRLSAAARSLAGGDYGLTIPAGTSDEIGELAGSFNGMAQDIMSRDSALKTSEEKYRSLIQNIPDVTWTANRASEIIFISPNIEKLSGYSQEEVYRDIRLWFLLAHRDDADKVVNAHRALFNEEKGYDIEYRIRTKSGQWLWIRDSAATAYFKDGIKYADGMFSDITAKKVAEDALKDGALRLRTAQQIARMGSWDWDILNNAIFWSEEVYRVFGLKEGALGATYESFMDHVHPADRELVKKAFFDAMYKGKDYSVEHRMVLHDATVRTVRGEGVVSFNEKGAPARMLGVIQDITDRKKTEFELKKLSMAIEHSVNIIFITNKMGVIEYVNPLFEEVTGYSREEALGQTPRILSSGEMSDAQYKDLWNTIISGKTWRRVLKNRKKDGGFYWCNSVISPIRNDSGEITHFLAVQEDITQKMLSDEKLKYLAHYDELTGLINRSRFMELMDKYIAYSSTNGATGALLLMDIDQFKLLNDTFGHSSGDDYLRRMGKLLQSATDAVYKEHVIGGKSFIGRLSGDEFAVFLPSLGKEGGLDVADRLRKAVEQSRFSEDQTSVTISVGIAIYPDHGADTGTLFTRADAAVYRAKELGRNRCHVYLPEDRDLEKMHSRLSWKEKILKALKEDRFDPWFQPILDLGDNEVHHYEVLARMRDENGAVLLPGAFIGIAETFGIVGAIDRVIIEKAMRLQAELKAQGKAISFAMNLSGKDLIDDDLLSFIQDKVASTGADPNRLIFEITETAAISDIDRAKRFVRALKSIGCNFSLDDFGVGFTSFTYLKELQVDFIKIDGAFVRKLHESPEDRLFVKAITEVAKGMNIKTIAEFVEDEAVIGLLKDYGVDYAQGYLIGKPAPALASRAIPYRDASSA